MLKRSQFCILGIVALTGSLGGCALTVDQCDIAYRPQSQPPRIKLAGAIKTVVCTEDQRSMKDKVSCKKNGYGMEMAPIVATREVSSLITEAITTELKNRGCAIGEGQSRVIVEIQKFWNDFKIGALSGAAEGEVILNVKVMDHSDSIHFSKVIRGESRIEGLMLASGENAKLALDAAMADAVFQLMADDQFFIALVDKGRRPTTTSLSRNTKHDVGEGSDYVQSR